MPSSPFARLCCEGRTWVDFTFPIGPDKTNPTMVGFVVWLARHQSKSLDLIETVVAYSRERFALRP